MKSFRLILFGLMVSLFGLSSLTRAEDIDLYSDNAANVGVPNVLFVVDNAGGFNADATSCTYVDPDNPLVNGTKPTFDPKAAGIQQCALYNVIKGLPEGAVNIGLMMYNSNTMRDINGANCAGNSGGCLVQPLALMAGTAKTNFLNWIRSWKQANNGTVDVVASHEATGESMQESWAYYAGQTGLSGRSYAGIQPTAGCQKNFVIFIGNAFGPNGTPGEGAGSQNINALAAATGITDAQKAIITIPSGSYGTSTFSCKPSYSMGNHTDSSGLYADEWARYMYQTDIYGTLDDKQGITTYTVGLLGSSCKPDYPALLTSMAKVGGGKYFATSSYDEISTAILKILNEIQAVNSVFSSASLPVSVNAQGTYLNQIFLGMFRPDASANPRWVGNLKQYQFILEYPDPSNPDPNKATLKLGDSAGNSAISSAGTGFITPDAVSFWTSKDITTAPDSTGGFFINDARGAGGAFDSPDGELVEKGGAAQQLRLNNLTVNYTSTPASPRRLYTYCPSGASCNASLSNSANAFATTNTAITDDLLSSISSVSVSSITRSGDKATVTTGANHGYNNGDSITISGAAQSEYNGTKTVSATPAPTANQFSFTVVEYPVTPATGSFTASIAGSPKAVSSMTRSGNLVTVSLPGHGFVNQSVTIGGATQTQYNGTFQIKKLTDDSFTYTIIERPISPAGGGTAKVAATTKVIESYNNNPNPGVVRATGSTTVTVTTTTNHGFANSGNVTIDGVLDPASNSPIAAYNGTFSYTKTGVKSFTYSIDATIPASPATGTITADGSAAAKDIKPYPDGLVRAGTVVTATTTTAHGFTTGQTVSIGGTAGTNEGGYVGSFPIKKVSDTSSFTYEVETTPQSPATGTISAQKSGTSDRTALINWVRGEDNFGDEASPGSGYTVRPSVHGDVLHSRPLSFNFGTDEAPKVVVFYGANDGVFRAVNGNQTGSISSGGVTVAPGGELWGLVLPEHFSKLNRQRVNSPELKMPSTALASAQLKDYFVDGSPGVYQLLKSDGTIDKAYIYLTMRRGGRFIYALNVSDPGDPKVMWKISSSDTGYGELGQTWSRPRVTLVKGYANPVLVFGAGYDPAEDAEPPTTDTMGRGIFVVDAVTGVRVWNAAYTAGTTACTGTTTQAACAVAGMNWAMPADISFVDRDNDGKTDRFYAADVGGNVWRVDLEPTAGITPDKWQVNKLAALGCASGSCTSGTTPRKFFFPPNVVSVGATGASGSYDVVLLGSGDREHPLESSGSFGVTNRFYALKDSATGMDASGTVITETELFNGGVVTGSTITYDGSLSGFYKTFATGEKSVNASVTTKGTTFFGTNKPTPPSTTSCRSNLGEAKGYALNPFKGTFDATVFDGGGLPPSPTTGIVNITLPDGSSVKKDFCIGCGGGGPGGPGGTPPCNSALEVCTPTNFVHKNPRRSYWYKK